MPFSMISAPATFTKAIQLVLMGLEEICTAYLNGIVVHRSSLKNHQNKIAHDFESLRKHDFRLQLNKCGFRRKEVLYLGHVTNETGRVKF